MMLFLVQAGTITHADIVDSLRRFGREVMPRFAGATRRAHADTVRGTTDASLRRK
jgi:hypothetical protein